ncbi:hypothetical protein EDC01DRAFT_614474 [Geopyxis carbonaria]|nr:hypothetical protein EDC01DRAFT_614474 [Geopyxis carbonaria]
MIVDISSALHATGIGQQLSVFLTNWGCEINAPWQPALGLESLWKVVKWRRRVKAEYSAAAGMFLPLPSGGEEVRDERHILVHLTAKEFVDLAYPIDPAASIDLATHVHKLKRLVPAAVTKDEPVTVIYMIEGLPAYIRKAKTSANRAFRTRVISAISGPYSNAATPPPPRVDEDMLEDALLLLQVEHKCLIHQTTNAAESAEWISILTSDISTIPYKAARRTGVDTAFCTDVGQVKTGSDPQDTFAKVLQEIARVTPAVANGVVEKYGNVTELVEAIQVDGNEVLAGLPLLSTRSGAPSQRSVGTALSRRISSVMLGTDPTQVDM